jgi:mono/diheme cytochrome c family protein
MGRIFVGGVLALFALVGVKSAKTDQVRRGEYLVKFGGCNHCHTPWVFRAEVGAPVPDMTRMLSGHPETAPDACSATLTPAMAGIWGPGFTNFKFPFGTVYAANLTPDKATGLGTWTEEMFVRTIRTGRHMGAPSARPVLPPMPVENLQTLSDEDLRAIFAYLRTVPPVHNAVPDHKVSPDLFEPIGKGNTAVSRALHPALGAGGGMHTP